MSQIAIDSQAPDFSLKDYQGNTVSLGQFKDKQTVLLILNRGFT